MPELIYYLRKTGDFERFGAQAQVQECHEGAEEEDTKPPVPIPESPPSCSSGAQQSASLPCLHGNLHQQSRSPSHPKQASDFITSPVVMERGSHLCLNTPSGL